MSLIRLRRKHGSHIVSFEIVEVVALCPLVCGSVDDFGGLECRHRDLVRSDLDNGAVVQVQFVNLVVPAISEFIET
jgi:hypothetical protein